MSHIIRKCSPEDLTVLCDLSRTIYDETFRHMNKPETMKAYLDKAFHPDQLRAELTRKGSVFYFLYAGDALTGYLKLNSGDAQTDLQDPEALEIERIYISKEFQGKGLGHILIDKAEAEAKITDKTYLWLGVWEQNEKAFAFYKSHGFTAIGTHSFIMGDEVQTDFVMRKDLI